jgi:hypothetical protein
MNAVAWDVISDGALEDLKKDAQAEFFPYVGVMKRTS